MDLLNCAQQAEKNELKPIFEQIEANSFKNSQAVLNAFQKHQVSESCFNSTTGYGYGDVGRDAIERVFSDISLHVPLYFSAYPSLSKSFRKNALNFTNSVSSTADDSSVTTE